MSNIEKKTSHFGGRDYTWYTIALKEIKTEKDCVEFARKLAGIGELKRVECRGYHDMDTHENYGFYDSIKEMDNDIERLKKLDLDTIRITTGIDGYHFSMEIQPVGNSANGTSLSVNGFENKKLAAAVQEVQRILKGWGSK